MIDIEKISKVLSNLLSSKREEHYRLYIELESLKKDIKELDTIVNMLGEYTRDSAEEILLEALNRNELKVVDPQEDYKNLKIYLESFK